MKFGGLQEPLYSRRPHKAVFIIIIIIVSSSIIVLCTVSMDEIFKKYSEKLKKPKEKQQLASDNGTLNDAKLLCKAVRESPSL